jgi:hypothetical protein
MKCHPPGAWSASWQMEFFKGAGYFFLKSGLIENLWFYFAKIIW